VWSCGQAPRRAVVDDRREPCAGWAPWFVIEADRCEQVVIENNILVNLERRCRARRHDALTKT